MIDGLTTGLRKQGIDDIIIKIMPIDYGLKERIERSWEK